MFGSLPWKLPHRCLGGWGPFSSGTWASRGGGDMHELDKEGIVDRNPILKKQAYI